MRYYIPPYIDIKQSILNLKISALYDDRKIKAFKKQLEIPFIKRYILKNRLAELQKDIYKLDIYFESNWDLSNSIINNLWDTIKQCIIGFGVDNISADNLLKRMYEYMQFELNIRNGNNPANIEIDEFYEHKICDVQLQRDLIHHISTLKFNIALLECWKTYDKICEIGDDIDDIREDEKNFNCNRFVLLSEKIGVENATKQYAEYLTKLNLKFEETVESNNLLTKELEHLTKLKYWVIDKTVNCNSQLKELKINFADNTLIQKMKSVNNDNKKGDRLTGVLQ